VESQMLVEWHLSNERARLSQIERVPLHARQYGMTGWRCGMARCKL
jgi:hypothetical protein